MTDDLAAFNTLDFYDKRKFFVTADFVRTKKEKESGMKHRRKEHLAM
jgi:hypothetical protein